MFDPGQRTSLLSHARASLRATVLRTGAAMPPSPAEFASPAGAFTTIRGGDGELRGCIGFVEARLPLWETVWRTAGEAAAEDHRFQPVRETELEGLRVEISVLSALRRARAEELVVGIHGILLSRGPRRGLLLPQVASERGWDAETFLGAGCEKAGLPEDAWRDGATLEVFTAEVISEE